MLHFSRMWFCGDLKVSNLTWNLVDMSCLLSRTRHLPAASYAHSLLVIPSKFCINCRSSKKDQQSKTTWGHIALECCCPEANYSPNAGSSLGIFKKCQFQHISWLMGLPTIGYHSFQYSPRGNQFTRVPYGKLTLCSGKITIKVPFATANCNSLPSLNSGKPRGSSIRSLGDRWYQRTWTCVYVATMLLAQQAKPSNFWWTICSYSNYHSFGWNINMRFKCVDYQNGKITVCSDIESTWSMLARFPNL